MITTGDLIAIKTKERALTAYVIEVHANCCVVKDRWGRISKINDWVWFCLNGKMIIHQPSVCNQLSKSKTIVVVEVLSCKPGIWKRFKGWMGGYRYKQDRKEKLMQADNLGHPRLVPRWTRRKKVRGALFSDGFFIPHVIQFYNWPVYFHNHNSQKTVVWKKVHHCIL